MTDSIARTSNPPTYAQRFAACKTLEDARDIFIDMSNEIETLAHETPADPLHLMLMEQATARLQRIHRLEDVLRQITLHRLRGRKTQAALLAESALAHSPSTTPARLVGYLYESERGRDWCMTPWSPAILHACLPEMTVTPLYGGKPMTRDEHIAQQSQATTAGLAPGLRPCECTTHCLHPGYTVDGDRTPPKGVVCRERSALPRLSDGPLPPTTSAQRCTCDADQSPCDFCDARMTERDAARYRFLRDRAVEYNGCPHIAMQPDRDSEPAWIGRERADAAIDSAMGRTPTTASAQDDPLAGVRRHCAACRTVNDIDDEHCRGCGKQRAEGDRRSAATGASE